MIPRWTTPALGLLILLTALAFGGVHEWASALMEMGLWALGAAWLLAGARPRWRACLPLYAVLAFQLIPLPPGPLAVLSPRTAELYRQTVGRIEALAPDQSEVRSVADVEDSQIPVARRRQILQIAQADRGWFPPAWRPLAIYPFAARADLLLYLAYAVALGLAAAVPTPGLLLRLILAGGVAIALLAIFELITWNGHVLWFFDPYDSGPVFDNRRMVGPFVNPDHFAAFLELVLAPGAALLMTTWRGRRNPRRGDAQAFFPAAAIAVGLAIVLAGLLGSASRSGILGAALSVAVLGWGTWSRSESGTDRIHSHRRRSENRAERARRLARRFAPPAAAAAIVIGAVLYAGPQARETLQRRISDEEVVSQFAFRSAMTLETLPMVRDFPLFGVGAGCWREVFRQYESYPLVGFRPNHAHNDYIEWAAEVGVVGLLATVVAAAALGGAIRRNRAIPAPIRWGILGAAAGIAWHEAYDFGLRAPANALALAVLLGLACNPNWRGRSEPDGRPTGRALTVGRILFVAVAIVGLASLSFRQLREFLQWSSVRGGSTELTIDPGNADTWDELATRLYEAGFRYRPPTRECLIMAVKLRPSFEGAFWRMSFTSTSYQDRLALLETALMLDPSRAEWRASYASLLDFLGHPAKALEEIETAVYRAPTLASHPYLDPRRQPSEKLLEAAERGFRRALGDRPDDPDLLAEVAAFYERFGIWGEAGSLFAKAADRSGDWAYFGRRAGSCYAKVLNFERAEELLRKSIAADPSDAESYRLLAISVLLPAKRFEEAVETLMLGIHRTPAPAVLYAALYEVRLAQGERRAAIEALTKAAELEPRNAERQFRLGTMYVEAEDYHRAEIALGRAIAIDPRRGLFHYYKGIAEERRYDLGGALADYRKAAALEPGNAAFTSSAERLAASIDQQKRGRDGE